MERRIDPPPVTNCRATHDRVQHHDYRLRLSVQNLPAPIAIELALILSMPRRLLPVSMTFAAAFELHRIAWLTDARIALRAGRKIHDLLSRQEPQCHLIPLADCLIAKE